MKTPTTSAERPGPLALAYLLSQYPMLSMTFVMREVLQLRAMGFRIDVASINDADRAPERLTAEDLSEARKTHYVLTQGLASALSAHAATLLTSPMAYVRGIALVFKLGRFDIKRLFKNTIYFTEALMVGRWMTQVGQQHLHVHLGSQAATVGLFVKCVFCVGYSITVHGPDEFYDATGQYLSEKVIGADFVICISHFARSQLMKLSPYKHWYKLHVSRLGVDPTAFSPHVRTRKTGDAFEVLCVGRLTPAKGQHILVEAVKLLITKGRAVRLRLVGEGVDLDSLLTQVRELGLGDVVIFEGAVNQDRIRDIYAQADCFCIPSFAEGIPVVLMEAMAIGVPCVTTHITGIPELIENGVSGLLVAPSNVPALAANIERLMDDRELLAKLSAHGRAKVLADFDLARNVAALGELFRELVSTSSSPKIRHE